ncbi:MAG: CotH kinase family protein [Bacteroidales bacterium]|nr:CotH kinase family protein [Bacteroidales bacterium]
MMRRISILLAALLLLVISCAEREGLRGRRNPSPVPRYFSEILAAIDRGCWYESAEDTDEYLIVRFDDGTVIDLPHDEVKIIDGNIFDEPDLFYEEDSGEWLRNLIYTGLYFEDRPNSKSYPLCLWFDSRCIKAYLCNGAVVSRSRTPSTLFTSFRILPSDNSSLTEEIVCSCEGMEIRGQRPRIYRDLVFRPRFECDAVSVKVGGEEQESGRSAQDFSQPVVYDVTLCDGSTASFTVILRPHGDLPAVYINTDGNRVIADKYNYIPGTIRIDDPLGEYSSELSFEAGMQIKGRGNSTWDYFPKKPYHIKLDEKAKPYGLKSDRDWIVTANYNDKSLLRNEVAFEMSRICGFSWTPVFYPVELYLNGSYHGLYAFGEHKEVNRNKVDINPDAGDVYLELECYPDEPYNFWTSMSVPLTYKDPEAPSDALRNQVEGFFREFEAALQSSYFADPNRGYAKYIDLKSFIDNYIIQELTKNYDGNLHKSTFFSLKKGGKLEFCHVWDFDLSLGNCNFFGSLPGGNGPEGFYVKDYGFQGYGWGWYYLLFQDPSFRKKVKDRWNELKPEFEKIPDFIDRRAEYIREAADRNFKRWPILSTNVWSQPVVNGSFLGEVRYMKDFYNKRFKWLDTEINKW